MPDVEKSDFSTYDMWRKIEPKSTFVEKNDKYEVCVAAKNNINTE